MPQIIEKVTVYTTKPVIGQYRFKDKIQIYPSMRKPLQKGRLFYPLNVEISFKQKGKTYFRYGTPYGSDQLTKQIIEIQHLLSVVTQFFFFNHIKSKSPIKNFTKKSCKSIEKGKINWYQDKVLDDRNVKNFVIPDFIDHILEIYYSLPKDLLLIFRRACFLFYSGIELRGTNDSLSFASFVSAIETLMSFDAKQPETCRECGQLKYRLSASFKEFIFTFGYGGKRRKGATKFVNKLYKYRSKILHSGQLLIGDMFWHSVGESDHKNKWEESFLHKDLLGVTRDCLINWLASQKSS